MTRRIILVALVAIMLVPMTASVLAQDSFDPYAPYRGETIVVSWPSLYHFTQAATLIPQFEEETGINVEVDFLQYQAMKPAQEVELQKPRTGEYDVVAWVVFTKSEYVINGYLEPLANFFVNPALADPSYNPDDLVAAWTETGGVVGGTNAYLPGPTQALYGLPFGAETSIMVYRQDIFDEHGLEVPTTYDEMLETAAYITENVEGVYGMTSRGAARAPNCAWLAAAPKPLRRHHLRRELGARRDIAGSDCIAAGPEDDHGQLPARRPSQRLR